MEKRTLNISSFCNFQKKIAHRKQLPNGQKFAQSGPPGEKPKFMIYSFSANFFHFPANPLRNLSS
jgi:hypothetical protein